MKKRLKRIEDKLDFLIEKLIGDVQTKDSIPGGGIKPPKEGDDDDDDGN